MADEKPKARPTRLRITACNQVYVGKNARGDEFTIYEVEASKADGSPVEEKLRSFENLPLEVLDLNVTRYASQKYGLSYTLSRRTKPNRDQQIAELNDKIDALSARLRVLEEKGAVYDDPDLQPSFGDIPL